MKHACVCTGDVKKKQKKRALFCLFMQQNQRKMVTFQPIDQEDEVPIFKRT